MDTQLHPLVISFCMKHFFIASLSLYCVLLCYTGISISALLYSNSVFPRPGEQTGNMMPSVCYESAD